MSSRGPIARRGAIAVWVAIVGVVLIGFVGLAMDAGVVLLAGSQLQIAADAGALAAARLVREDVLAARQAAYDIAYENKAMLFATKAPGPIRLDIDADNMAPGDVVIGHYFRFADEFHDCCPEPCLCPTLESPNAVRVRARRTSTSLDNHVPLVFGAVPLFNVEGIDVTRSATAMIGGGTGPGMLVLDPDGECALDIRGHVVIDLESAPGYDGDTAIQVNSDDPCAFCGNGSFEIHAPNTNIVGMDPGYCIDGSPEVDTYLNPDSAAVPDPLAYLVAPSIGPNRGSINPSTDAPTYYPPGYYAGGMKISGSRNVLLGTASPGQPPGIYIVEGAANGSTGGFQTTGGASVTALNVMIYVKSGKLDLGGGGVTRITPMTEEHNSDTYYIDVAIFQARDNFTESRITGNANMDLQGTYYFPRNRLDIGGTGIAIGNQLIAWQLYLHGTGEFTIMYDGRFPAPGSKVFLVE